MKLSLMQLWGLTQQVKESIDLEKVQKWVGQNIGKEWKCISFETDKDEVLQVINGRSVITVIGGSSADKFEWISNFNWRWKKKDPFSKNVKKTFHKGFFLSAMKVIWHPKYNKTTLAFVGHSRGGAIASILAYKMGGKGFGFGSPKAFRKAVNVDFVNVRNSLDPVCWVVPFFKAVGKVVKLKFIKNPHTKYGKHLGGVK